jgi:hypothetical protein
MSLCMHAVTNAEDHVGNPPCFAQLFVLEVRAELDNVQSIHLPKGTTYTLTVRTLVCMHLQHMHQEAQPMSSTINVLHRVPPMQVKNSSGEDTREGVEVSAAKCHRPAELLNPLPT